jgi:hypothetical protein
MSRVAVVSGWNVQSTMFERVEHPKQHGPPEGLIASVSGADKTCRLDFPRHPDAVCVHTIHCVTAQLGGRYQSASVSRQTSVSTQACVFQRQ